MCLGVGSFLIGDLNKILLMHGQFIHKWKLPILGQFLSQIIHLVNFRNPIGCLKSVVYCNQTSRQRVWNGGGEFSITSEEETNWGTPVNPLLFKIRLYYVGEIRSKLGKLGFNQGRPGVFSQLYLRFKHYLKAWH